MSNIWTKISTHNTMPSSMISRSEIIFYMCCNLLILYLNLYLNFLKKKSFMVMFLIPTVLLLSIPYLATSITSFCISSVISVSLITGVSLSSDMNKYLYIFNFIFLIFYIYTWFLLLLLFSYLNITFFSL